jgi:hypothetical protein
LLFQQWMAHCYQYVLVPGNIPHNKTPTQDRDIVRQHIESFPTMESHYTRKDSNKQYLSCDLSIRKMVDLYSILFE